MKKTQKLHKKTKSSKIRKTRKLQKGGIRNPFKTFKNWVARIKAKNTFPPGVPYVTHNPGVVNQNRVNAMQHMRSYNNLSGYEGSNHEPKGKIEYEGNNSSNVQKKKDISNIYATVTLTDSTRAKKIAKKTAEKARQLKVRGEGSYASVHNNNSI